MQNFIRPIAGIFFGVAAITMNAADSDSRYASWPDYQGDDLELMVDNAGTHFTLWSPEAKAAEVLLYPTDRNSAPVDTLHMTKGENGTWRASVPQKLLGKFYTFRVDAGHGFMAETPGVWAKAVGTNGRRAAIIDMSATDLKAGATTVGRRQPPLPMPLSTRCTIAISASIRRAA